MAELKNFVLLHGTMSTFGGPDDMGVSPSEGLALCEESEIDLFEEIFLEDQPEGTTGLARRLDPETFYVAARWDYDQTSRQWLQLHQVVVSNPRTGMVALAQPIDWGPNQNTGRVCDLSPGLVEYLELSTDDVCEMLVPLPPVTEATATSRICISAGHGMIVRGAAGPPPWGLDEVNEARRVVTQLSNELRLRSVEVKTFWDDTSVTQDQNLKTIVNWHNGQPPHDLDVSIHFNAYDVTDEPMGTEVLYLTQDDLAREISAAIATCGFIDRGAKHRTDLYVLNNTIAPCVLIEVCFVDSKPDCNLYRLQFEQICKAIAMAMTGSSLEEIASA